MNRRPFMPTLALHATILHLLGIDPEKLTYRFGGRDMCLTDVSDEVVQEVIA